MKFRTRLRVDDILGGFIVWVLNIAVRIAGKIFRRDHTFKKNPRAILFLKFVGLGSIIRASFLIRESQRSFPRSRIYFCSFGEGAQLARLYQGVDRVLVIREKNIFLLCWDTLKTLSWLWGHKVDLVIDLEVHSKYSSIFSALTFARDRAGFSYISSRFRQGIYSHLVYWNPHRHVDKSYRQLGRVLGFDKDFTPMDLTIAEEERQKVSRLCVELGIGKDNKLLGINPNAGELSVERRWPVENFAKIIRRLPEDPKLRVLLFGSLSEHSYVESLEFLAKDSKVKIHNLAGKLTFPMFIALLEKLNLFITNDSGPLHLSDLLKVPTLSLWGPTSPFIYGPRGKHHKAFYRPIFCSPCVHITDSPPCGGNNQCLKLLSWGPVLKQTLLMMGYDNSASSTEKVKPDPDFVAGYWSRQELSS